ncbi:MAG TPA: hypothetical protein VL528_08325 [Oxalicibacterium sp.]|jgi:hypothetical protein|nr:hypothetical protein [Oxalicibacterium sp.]
MMRALLMSALMLALFGCGEKIQSQTNARDAGDQQAYLGAHDPFVTKGWTAGNKAEWEKHMRARTQTQNESVRINGI